MRESLNSLRWTFLFLAILGLWGGAKYLFYGVTLEPVSSALGLLIALTFIYFFFALKNLLPKRTRLVQGVVFAALILELWAIFSAGNIAVDMSLSGLTFDPTTFLVFVGIETVLALLLYVYILVNVRKISATAEKGESTEDNRAGSRLVLRRKIIKYVVFFGLLTAIVLWFSWGVQQSVPVV